VALIHQGQYEEADKHLMQALREVSVKRRREGRREGGRGEEEERGVLVTFWHAQVI